MMPTAPAAHRPFVLPAWFFDLALGIISICFGLGLLLWRSQTVAVVVWILAFYILLDGVFDIIFTFRDRRQHGVQWTRLVIGVLSCLTAWLLRVNPAIALLFFVYYVAAQAAFHGAMDLWELVTSFWRRAASLLLLFRGMLLIFLSAALVFARVVALHLYVTVFVVYVLVNGLGYLASAAVKADLITLKRLGPGPAQASAADLANPPRAMVFVRRSGAKGMGHVGWGFEWRTGWFNVGSVENRSNAAFAPPDKMDFWTTHTLHPVATMLGQPTGYDEFKVFRVTDPQAKAAWNTVVWLSRQPYSVLRRNCSDCACDVLRAYGVASVVDTAQENVPNQWYDTLPGPSHAISDHPDIPLNPARMPRLARLSVQEIELSIPAGIKAAPPPWRARGGRAWYEVQQRWHKVTVRARGLAHATFAQLHAFRKRTLSQGDHQGSAADHPTG